jgi:hypothetical protein
MIQGVRFAWLALAAAAASCARADEAPELSRPKPHAPVELRLDATPLAPGRHRVTLEARALAPLATLELHLLAPGGESLAASAPAAARTGERRALTVDVDLPEVVGAARTPAGSRARSLVLDAAAAAKPAPARTVITPFGPAAEVRE